VPEDGTGEEPMEESSLVFRPSVDLRILIPAVVLLFALSILAYARTSRPVRAPLKAFLLGLRGLAMGLLLLCVLRPNILTTSYTVQKRPLVFLIDRSRSMSRIHDTPGGVSRLEALTEVLTENEDALDALRERYELVVLGFARGLLSAQDSDRTVSAGFSAYGRAIEEAFEDVVGRDCQALVVFGDGSHNLGPPDPLDAAAMLSERGIPLYTVGVGSEEATRQVRDVKISSLEVPDKALVFTRFPVRGDVLFRGCRGLEVAVKVELDGQEVDRRTVHVAHDDEVVPVQFELKASDMGEHRVTLSSERIPEEILYENNVARDYVKVVRSGVRVGYFDRLRPECKFITLALQGAQHINLRRMLSAGSLPFSEDQADWKRYDVVVIGDVDALAFETTQMVRLKESVLKGGRGLILLGGSHSGGERGFQGSPIADVLPVKFAPNAGLLEGEHRFQVQRGYIGLPALAIGDEQQATAEAWEKMPPLTAVLGGAEPKRGAEVLARDEAANPLLVVQRAGKGRAVCLLSDTTFRWFFTEEDTQDRYRRFWRQMVLWAGRWEEQKDRQFRVELSKRRLLPAEELAILLHATDAEGKPIRDALISLRVGIDGGKAESIPCSFSREEGVFRAQYVPSLPGDYIVTAEARRAGVLLGRDARHFQVSAVDRELEEPVANFKLLRRLSAATADSGGRFYRCGNARRLFEHLLKAGEPLKLATRKWQDLWDSPLLFVLFLMAIATEWGIRRWKGLI